MKKSLEERANEVAAEMLRHEFGSPEYVRLHDALNKCAKKLMALQLVELGDLDEGELNQYLED